MIHLVPCLDSLNLLAYGCNSTPGSSATVVVPELNKYDLYNFVFGDSPGFGYSVNISDSCCRLSFNSLPYSALIIKSDGTSENKVPSCFGYYFIDNTEAISIFRISLSDFVVNLQCRCTIVYGKSLLSLNFTQTALQNNLRSIQHELSRKIYYSGSSCNAIPFLEL